MGSKNRKAKKNSTPYEESFKMTVMMGQKIEILDVNGDLFFPCKMCKRLFRKEVEVIKHFQICKSQYQNKNINGKLNETSEEVDSKSEPINNNYVENKKTKNRKRNTKTLNVSESPAEKEKIVKQGRRGKRLTEEEIAERLRIISEKLKKKAEVKVFYEDEEEEERREIEDRLTALNKDSEISYFNDYPEFDDRLKDDDATNEFESKDSVRGNLVDNSKNLKTTDGILNPLGFNELGHLNSTNSTETIIITQRPDGQLHGCLRCTEVFFSELDLLRHKRAKHTAPKIIMAPSEIKKFYDVSDRSQCPICKRVLLGSNKSIYIKHLQSHTYIGEFECSICKKKFKRKDHMRMHEKRHIV